MIKKFKSHATFNIQSRKLKAKKIISIITEYKKLNNTRILDIGIGAGVITTELSRVCKEASGVDIVDERISKNSYLFKRVTGTLLPFADKSFDIVISNQVFEHVKNQKEHLNEIYRVLKKEGICYLATPNKFWIIESHYKLPFLSMLPKKLANFYLKLFTKNNFYDINLLSYNKIISLIRKKFRVEDITLKVIKHPKKYYLEKNITLLCKLLPKIKLIRYLLPSFIFILKKP